MKILRVSIDRRRDDKPASGIEVEALGPLAALLSGLASLCGRVADRDDRDDPHVSLKELVYSDRDLVDRILTAGFQVLSEARREELKREAELWDQTTSDGAG